MDLAPSFQACIVVALVIHFTKDELITFFQRMSQYLVEDGKIWVVIKVGSGMDQKAGTKKYNEKIYRRPVYLYTLQDVLTAAKTDFSLCQQIESDSPDRLNVVLQKNKNHNK